ncbi:hypothetical protein ACFLTQ_02390 [Chloroflexota bacterium]
MQKHDLLVKWNTRIKAARTSGKNKPRPTRSYEWWGIDMTKVMVEGFDWMYIVVVLDWYTKKLLVIILESSVGLNTGSKP